MVLVSVAVGTRGGDHPAGPTTPSPSTSAETGAVAETYSAHREAARAEAARILTLVSLPTDTEPLDGQPPGGAVGEEGIGPSDADLTQTGWWTVPASPTDVQTYLLTHQVDGFTVEDATAGTSIDGHYSLTFTQTSSTEPTAYRPAFLLLRWKALGGGTAVRADAFIGAYDVRDPDSLLGEVTSVAVARTVGPSEDIVDLTRADGQQPTRLVDAFQGLSASMKPPVVASCPAPVPGKEVTDTITPSTRATSTTPCRLCSGRTPTVVEEGVLRPSRNPATRCWNGPPEPRPGARPALRHGQAPHRQMRLPPTHVSRPARATAKKLLPPRQRSDWLLRVVVVEAGIVSQDRERAAADVPDFEHYVAARGAALQRFAALVSGDVAEAADLVQDALLRAYPRWSRLSEAGSVDAYVKRSIVNGSISRWRKLRRSVPVSDPVSGHTPDPALRWGDADLAWRLCAGLPRSQRAAVVLRFYEDLSYAEIGTVLHCRESTARAYVHRALAQLRTVISASPDTDGQEGNHGG